MKTGTRAAIGRARARWHATRPDLIGKTFEPKRRCPDEAAAYEDPAPDRVTRVAIELHDTLPSFGVAWDVAWRFACAFESAAAAAKWLRAGWRYSAVAGEAEREGHTPEGAEAVLLLRGLRREDAGSWHAFVTAPFPWRDEHWTDEARELVFAIRTHLQDLAERHAQ